MLIPYLCTVPLRIRCHQLKPKILNRTPLSATPNIYRLMDSPKHNHQGNSHLTSGLVESLFKIIQRRRRQQALECDHQTIDCQSKLSCTLRLEFAQSRLQLGFNRLTLVAKPEERLLGFRLHAGRRLVFGFS